MAPWHSVPARHDETSPGAVQEPNLLRRGIVVRIGTSRFSCIVGAGRWWKSQADETWQEPTGAGGLVGVD